MIYEIEVTETRRKNFYVRAKDENYAAMKIEKVLTKNQLDFSDADDIDHDYDIIDEYESSDFYEDVDVE